MPSWKKIITSGSSAHLHHVSASGNISGSLTTTGSFGTIQTTTGTIPTLIGDTTFRDALTLEDNLYIPDSIVHASDTNTKIRFPEADTIAFNTSGVERMRISAAGHVTASGDVSSSASSTGSFGHVLVDGTTLSETIADTVGAMVGSNTETGISVTYQDGDNTLDFALDAAQTTITSLLATNIKIGEDDQTKIDFGTTNEINFAANNQFQMKLTDGVFQPVSDSDVDLGQTGARWKDAYIDTITTTGNVSGSSSSTGSFGHVHIADGRAGLGIGDDNDLLLYHDGSHSYIKDSGTGNLYYRGGTQTIQNGAGSKTMAVFNAANSVDLNYNNNTKFQTTNTGVSITGNVIATGTLRTNSGATMTGSLYVSGSIGGDAGAISASGDIVADGDIIAYNASDEKLKDNIEVIQGSLDKIGDIRGVEFDWNEKSPGWARERGHDVGVIAQEVQKVLPEIVTKRKNGYLGVDYKRIVPLLIESIKELKQEVEELKKKVN